MPFITPKDPSVVEGLDGLHLYHAGVSNCAMRVRMTLEEKGLDWESHHLDIFKKENLTEEYFAINPTGLVPCLVHNRQIINESDDIIDYLDKTFPNPPLRPSDPEALETMNHWLHLGPAIHFPAIKTYIYYIRIRGKMVHSPEEQERYERLQTNKDILEFHQKSFNDAFTEEDINKAREILQDCFSKLEAILTEHNWIAGDEYSLADITWVPLYFTLDVLTGYDFSKYPNMQKWAERIYQRPSYKKGVTDWWPQIDKK